MKKSIPLFIVGILAIWGLVGCETEVVEPIRNPRFSVAFVQEINADGAQFAANVYDLGTQEIVEYGFVYETGINPRLETGEILKTQGSPPDFFEMFAEHGMVNNITYNVRAFMKTTDGITYSNAIRFRSVGSKGFVINEIIQKDRLYVGDTVTVSGVNFSGLGKNYVIRVEGVATEVISPTNTEFKFRFPKIINSQNPNLINGYYALEFIISDKKHEREHKFSIIEPVVGDSPFQKVNYGDTVFVYGKFLEVGYMKIISSNPNQGGDSFNNQLVYRDSVKVGFIPDQKHQVKSPELEIQIRDTKKKLGKVFEFNPSIVYPNQNLQGLIQNSFIIKGENFNTEMSSIYQLIGQNDMPRKYSLKVKSPTEIEAQFTTSNQFEAREFDINFTHYGVTLHNATRVLFTDPNRILFYYPPDIQQLQFGLYAGSASFFEGKGYIIGNTGTIVIDFDKKNQTTLPASYKQIFYPFNVQVGSKVYIGGGVKGSELSNESSREFVEFDMRTQQNRTLRDLPFDSRIPVTTFQSGDFIYVQGSTHLQISGMNVGGENYKYSISKNEWTKLPDLEAGFRFWLGNNTFHYKGEVYKIGYDTTGFKYHVYKFNPGNELWIYQFEVGLIPIGRQTFVIGDDIYFPASGGIGRINMVNKTAELARGLQAPCVPMNGLSQMFMRDNKFYMHCYTSIVEYDPRFFTY